MPDLVTRYGLMSVPDAESDLIGRFLVLYGEWAWLEARFIASIVPEHGRVLDIGAFIGTFGIGLSLLRKLDLVCFVEPNEIAIPYLTRNVKRLCKAPAAIVEALVGDRSGAARAGRSDVGNLGSASFAVDVPPDVDQLRIEPPPRSITLAELFENNGTFDLIKIDAEGMEAEILSGIGSAADAAPIIWAECNEHPQSLELGRLLLSLGRPVYYFAFPSFNRDNFSKNPAPIYSFAYESGLLAGPRVAPELPDDLRASGCILRRINSISEIKLGLWETPRWGNLEWHGRQVETIVALAGRQLLGQDIDSFLTPDEAIARKANPQSVIEVLRLRIRALQDAQQRTEAQVEQEFSYRTELQRQMEAEAKDLQRRMEAEANQNLAQIRLLKRQLSETDGKHRSARQELDVLREHGRELSNRNAVLQDENAVLAGRSRKLDEIEQSTTWQLAQGMLTTIASRPALHRGLRRGLRRLRRTHPHGVQEKTVEPPAQPAISGIERDEFMSEVDAARPHFDPDYYLFQYPDVRSAGVDPLEHFMVHGWKEGRNPNPEFDIQFYARSNPDVIAAGMNPFLHYICAGAAEGRKPHPDNPVLRRRLELARPLSLRAQDWLRPEPTAVGISKAELATTLCGSIKQLNELIISVSHDDYIENIGGVQNAIRDEENAFTIAGCGYLHLCPDQPLPLLAPNKQAAFSVRLNGRKLGVAAPDVVIAALRDAVAQGARPTLILHHFMGHAPESLAEIARLCARDRRFVWAHDFFLICPNYLLLRNDVAFCGGPPLDSPACSICVYDEDRRQHHARISEFFAEIRPHMAVPSEHTADFWRRAADFPYTDLTVIPHCQIAFDADPPPRGSAEPLRVAFTGAPAYHKGWAVFTELASRHRCDPRYEFFRLGVAEPSPPPHIKQITVRVTGENRDAMIEALRSERIDIAVIWSLTAETFSFIVHEAFAAGVFVLTSRASGNVASAIDANPQQGLIIEDADALFKGFATGEICKTLASSSRRAGHLIFKQYFPNLLLRDKNDTIREVA